MSELKEKLQQFTKDLEDNIENKNDLTYVKEKISELCMFFLDEMERIVDIEEKKVRNVAIRQKDLEEKINKIQTSLDNIEKDIYMEDEGFDYEIVCPYCGNEFVACNSEEETEIECPECHNIIELDWSGDSEEDGCCGGGCSHCHGHDDNDDNEEDNEDM